MINVFQPSLGDEELRAVSDVFSSNWIGRGKTTEEFEKRFANYIGVDAQNLLSISSCTEGLFQAIELLGIGVGDEIILPTVSFVGAANAIAHSGATPIFCDVEYRSLNTNARLIEDKITERTKAVVVLQYGGVPPEMSEIVSLCRHRGLILIEDTACGVASRYSDRACGTLGDIGVWSFDAMKILVTGDGGMLYFRDESLARKARLSTYLGLVSPSGFGSAVDNKWWQFEVDGFGRRSIMNDISSAIGLVQLDRLPEFIERRRKIWMRYQNGMRMNDVRLPVPPAPWRHSSYYLYWIQVNRRDELASYLKRAGIYTTFRYYPLHLVSAYGPVVRGSLPRAEWVADHTLCLPMHQSLTDSEVDFIIDQVRSFYAG
jgi:aminotransferase